MTCTVDALARFMAEELRKALGQTVIVGNQAGWICKKLVCINGA